jgi:hypothetical protein
MEEETEQDSEGKTSSGFLVQTHRPSEGTLQV